MTTRLGPRSGAAVVLLAALAAIPASPAAAAEPGPVITIDSPRASPPLDSSSVTVSGSAAVDSALYAMKEVVLAVGSETRTIKCTESPCPFSWRLTRPLNGPYELKVTATEATVLLGTAGPSSQQVRRFAVAAPPARPVLDPPKVTDGRTVELSWTRNTEPDMLYYAVFRKDPGGGRFLQVGSRVPQPAAGSRVTFTDTTPLTNGGDYAYQVVAVRRGASGTAGSEVTSQPSAASTATLPAPPSTTAAPAPGTPAGGPATTAKPGPPGGVDLSGFLSSRSEPVTPPPVTLPQPPDTGFDPNLPFAARPPGEELEEGEAEAVPPPRRSTSVITRVNSGRPLVPVAGGLVLLLLALHMRLLARRVKPAADSDLPIETGVAAPRPERVEPLRGVSILEPELGPEGEPEAGSQPEVHEVVDDDAEWVQEHPQPEPEPEPERPPAPQFYDVMQDADWAPREPNPAFDEIVDGLDMAPVAADREPAPAADPAPEPVVTALWAPPVEESPRDRAEYSEDPDYPEEAMDAEVDADEIEVFEVVSPTRRRLARAGSR